MMRLMCICVAAVLASVSGYAQNTYRGKLKLREEQAECKLTTDSTTAVRQLRVSGFEKTQSSNSESMFVTNNSDVTIRCINITITYLNMRGEMLHRRTEDIECELSVGETRNFSFAAWDKQRLWYYKLSQAKHSEYGNPFDVKVRINYVKY